MVVLLLFLFPQPAGNNDGGEDAEEDDEADEDANIGPVVAESKLSLEPVTSGSRSRVRKISSPVERPVAGGTSKVRPMKLAEASACH